MEGGTAAAPAAFGEKRHVLVVGAGPVGALAALFLRQHGFRVSLYEKRPDPRKTDGRGGRSINLALANRGIGALTRAGVMPRIWPLLIPMRGRMVHPMDGQSTLQPYGQSDEEVIYSVSRHELNVALVEALTESASRQSTQQSQTQLSEPPLTVCFGAACEQVNLKEKFAVFTSDDRHTVYFDHIIGADGAGSVVREHIQVYATADQVQDLGDEDDKKPSVTMLPLGHGYKELTIPPTAAGSPALDQNALHIWPRGNHMMIALPNQDASFTATLFLPLHGEYSFASLGSVQTQAQFLQEHYGHALRLMPQWQGDFELNPVGSLATLQCSQWYYRDRALLIGDAAHAIVPFHGQGMNCGFEDCGVLDACLKQYGDMQDWSTLFSVFTAERQPDCAAIAKMAIENYEEMRASVVDPVFLLKKAVGLELQRRFPGRFTPRYSMVMFGQVPYAQALRIGQRNEEILTKLVSGKPDLSQIDWDWAEQLLVEAHPGERIEGLTSPE